MKKKYINDLADLYTGSVINENTDVEKEPLNENVEVGVADTNINDAAGIAPADSGPNVSGVQLPIDNGDNDSDGISNQNITQDLEQSEKEEKKPENLNEKSINNSNMSKPNIFDKLYATIMEADDLEDVDLDSGLGDEGSPEDDLEELGVEDEVGGDEITLSLPRDLAEKLHEALMSQLEGDDDGGDDIDDFGGEDDLDFGADEDPLMETGEVKTSGAENGGKPSHAPDGKAHLQSKKHEVKSTVKPKGGSADGSAGGEEDGGKPRACNTGENEKLKNPKGDNKVGAGAEWG